MDYPIDLSDPTAAPCRMCREPILPDEVAVRCRQFGGVVHSECDCGECIDQR